MLSIEECDLHNKRVLIRCDFNVPIDNGVVTNDKRLRASLPTIEYALAQGAAVILLSHLGRPQEGKVCSELSLACVAPVLAQLIGRPVRFEANWLDNITVRTGEVVLCENSRFLVGEKANDPELAKLIASLCDVFVMDAFGCCHRAHASTVGVARYAPVACAGLLLTAEIRALTTVMQNPNRPLLTIIGGAKVSSKLAVLSVLAHKSDNLIVGGGMANTFLQASGYEIGKSLCEPEQIAFARSLLQKTEIPLPCDVVVTNAIDSGQGTVKAVKEVSPTDIIVDIGPETAEQYRHCIQQASTILWNGPVGIFEIPAFAGGTEAIARAIADSDAYSVAGGGDTIAAIDTFNVAEKISYISTGGGAFLEFVEGQRLPGIEVLTSKF